MHVNCRDFRLLCAFFFFKQKTAYELRISDWSSDVCSSDLASRVRRDIQAPVTVAVTAGPHATASPLATDMASAPAVLAEADSLAAEIGRASCRESVCLDVSIARVAGSLNKRLKKKLGQVHAQQVL